MAGQPTLYTSELGNRLCAELALGKSLRTVCGSDEMPCVATVFNWFKAQPEFLEQYTRAKEESADALTDEMLFIADEEKVGVDATSVGHAKLRIETRKWLASKLKPKKYGDKIQQEITGKVEFTDLTDDQLDQKLKSLTDATRTDTPTED